MKNKPNPEDYGYIPANTPWDEHGWTLEGGEEAYNRDLQIWECNPPSQEEFQSQFEVPATRVETEEITLKRASEIIRESAINPQRNFLMAAKDFHYETTGETKSLEEMSIRLNDMMSKQIKSDVRNHLTVMTADLLRLIIQYDCRPSEITEIVRIKTEVNPDPLANAWWQTGKIIDIKINKKD